VGRWRAWRKDKDAAGAAGAAGARDAKELADDGAVRRGRVFEAMRAAKRALALAPCAVEPTVLQVGGARGRAARAVGGRWAGGAAERGGERGRQAWGLLLLGNFSHAADFCEARRVREGGAGGAGDALPRAPELWVLHARALHLAGRAEAAAALLARAVALDAAWAGHAVEAPHKKRPSPGPDARAGVFSRRDRERVLRECKFEAALLEKLRAALAQAAPPLRAPVVFSRTGSLFCFPRAICAPRGNASAPRGRATEQRCAAERGARGRGRQRR